MVITSEEIRADFTRTKVDGISAMRVRIALDRPEIHQQGEHTSSRRVAVHDRVEDEDVGQRFERNSYELLLACYERKKGCRVIPNGRFAA